MTLPTMAVLVTGATGFVGSWLVRRLLELGEEVRVLYRPSSGLEDVEGLGVRGIPGDVTDSRAVAEACKGVDRVYHLAGVVGYSRAMRPLMDKVNVEGTRNVVDAVASLATGPDLIYMSSVVAVGASFDGRPLNEESPFNVGHLNLGYFETKRAAEKIVLEACRAGRIRAFILNPSTIYGPGDARKGSRGTQLKVARGRMPFFTSGGVSIVSVHDVVDVLTTVTKKGKPGERYILSGENITIHDLFTKIASLSGARPPTIHMPTLALFALGRVGDILERWGKKGPINTENAWTAVLFHWFDHSKATRELGFNPRPATEALKQSVDWMRDNGLLS